MAVDARHSIDNPRHSFAISRHAMCARGVPHVRPRERGTRTTAHHRDRAPTSCARARPVLTSVDHFLAIVDVYLVQGSSLIGFEALVTAHGDDPAALLDLAGIDPVDATASLRCATPSPTSKVPPRHSAWTTSAPPRNHHHHRRRRQPHRHRRHRPTTQRSTTGPPTQATPTHGGTVPRVHRRTRPMVVVSTIPTTGTTDHELAPMFRPHSADQPARKSSSRRLTCSACSICGQWPAPSTTTARPSGI